MAGRIGEILGFLHGRDDEQFSDIDSAGIAGKGLEGGQHKKRHHHGARPIGYLVDVKGRPLGQQHGLGPYHRHGAPGHLPEQGQGNAGENVGPRRAAMVEDGAARPLHVRRVDILAHQLEGEIGLDRGADVEVAVVIEGPAAVPPLGSPQVGRQLGLDGVVDHVEVMIQQNVLGRDRGVGFQGEGPLAVTGLFIDQPRPGFFDDGIYKATDIIRCDSQSIQHVVFLKKHPRDLCPNRTRIVKN